VSTASTRKDAARDNPENYDYRQKDLITQLAWRAGVPTPPSVMPIPLRDAANANLFFGVAPALLLDSIGNPSISWFQCLYLLERLQKGLYTCEKPQMLATRWAWAGRRLDRPVFLNGRPYPTPLEAHIAATRNILNAIAVGFCASCGETATNALVDWRTSFWQLWWNLAGTIHAADEVIRQELFWSVCLGAIATPSPALVVAGCQDISAAWNETMSRHRQPVAPSRLLPGSSEGPSMGTQTSPCSGERSTEEQCRTIVENTRPLVERMATAYSVHTESAPSAYRPAKEFLDADKGPKDYDELHQFLKSHPEIRTRRPWSQRLLIHAGDWMRYRRESGNKVDPLDLSAEIVDAVVQAEARKQAIRRSKAGE
jgi:hypothetical protein